ncbi:hypothetical protein SJAG_01785 [Schizosaccharomyces japonicus yFS275]|uniref:Uncharacterized protein n=1 Tax=Schizosaccharomyces japonicus (strain yFS275 / FY16936) TaxID=402676 RepID=B6JYW4_SCHJY|nr:hypothetical protein SJAG_01785 [Schizosaccharomyces japonicus yFS275]EEB06732.1 hypothetical protein SJAG_01785 [Schizosaccharomyces japonicus yFS275]
MDSPARSARFARSRRSSSSSLESETILEAEQIYQQLSRENDFYASSQRQSAASSPKNSVQNFPSEPITSPERKPWKFDGTSQHRSAADTAPAQRTYPAESTALDERVPHSPFQVSVDEIQPSTRPSKYRPQRRSHVSHSRSRSHSSHPSPPSPSLSSRLLHFLFSLVFYVRLACRWSLSLISVLRYLFVRFKIVYFIVFFVTSSAFCFAFREYMLYRKLHVSGPHDSEELYVRLQQLEQRLLVSHPNMQSLQLFFNELQKREQFTELNYKRADTLFSRLSSGLSSLRTNLSKLPQVDESMRFVGWISAQLETLSETDQLLGGMQEYHDSHVLPQYNALQPQIARLALDVSEAHHSMQALKKANDELSNALELSQNNRETSISLSDLDSLEEGFQRIKSMDVNEVMPEVDKLISNFAQKLVAEATPDRKLLESFLQENIQDRLVNDVKRSTTYAFLQKPDVETLFQRFWKARSKQIDISLSQAPIRTQQELLEVYHRLLKEQLFNQSAESILAPDYALKTMGTRIDYSLTHPKPPISAILKHQLGLFSNGIPEHLLTKSALTYWCFPTQKTSRVAISFPRPVPVTRLTLFYSQKKPLKSQVTLKVYGVFPDLQKSSRTVRLLQGINTQLHTTGD